MVFTHTFKKTVQLKRVRRETIASLKGTCPPLKLKALIRPSLTSTSNTAFAAIVGKKIES